MLLQLSEVFIKKKRRKKRLTTNSLFNVKILSLELFCTAKDDTCITALSYYTLRLLSRLRQYLLFSEKERDERIRVRECRRYMQRRGAYDRAAPPS